MEEMENGQSIATLIHTVRNQLQPFWSLVELTLYAPGTIPQSEIDAAAVITNKNMQLITDALEQIVQISEKKLYTEDDMYETLLHGISATTGKKPDIEWCKKEIQHWLMLIEYKKKKQDGNTNK